MSTKPQSASEITPAPGLYWAIETTPLPGNQELKSVSLVRIKGEAPFFTMTRVLPENDEPVYPALVELREPLHAPDLGVGQ